MPFFRDDPVRGESGEAPEIPQPQHGFSPSSASQAQSSRSQDSIAWRKLPIDSIRTNFPEGSVPESQLQQLDDDHDDEPFPTCSDRSELIERLKRGESPTWVPQRHAGSRVSSPVARPLWGRQPTPTSPPVTSSSTTRKATSPTALLPPPTITPEKKRDVAPEEDASLQMGLSIERPRSALHSGDFTHDHTYSDDGQDKPRPDQRMPDAHGFHDHHRTIVGRHQDRNHLPWLATSPPRDFNPFRFETRDGLPRHSEDASFVPSSPLSSSIASSFAYKPPTSPLVQSESNDDLDMSNTRGGMAIHSPPQRTSRRHTLMSSHTDSLDYPQPSPRHLPSFRQERTFPSQAHQPRRSLTSVPNFSFSGSSPQTPGFHYSRRPSIGSDISPLQHASMVGSYEESIMRGRMSTTPSKPLDFLAQIGVLGLGKCKPSLRCPSHVTLPFPAVFYSYASSSYGRSKMEDGPSPYVGQIDLENGLPNREDNPRMKRKMQTRVSDMAVAEDSQAESSGRPSGVTLSQDARKTQRRRHSAAPRAPPGGSYRISEKGQLQIIIKNPNKTAVKLFLVPYDLAGMEPGTKTFIRQRSYSAGPIIENMPDLKEPEAADRPILRYLLHLHICCPSKGRYYLYKSIRVVFANRVPDGKEKLQNEVTLPEPRFTPYKPIRMMHPPISAGTGPGSSLAAEKAFRRRSSGFYSGAGSTGLDMVDDAQSSHPNQRNFVFNFGGGATPVEPVPFGILNGIHRHKAPLEESRDAGPAAQIRSPGSSQTSRPTTQDSSDTSSLDNSDANYVDKYHKLRKGDIGYGGNAFSGIINGSPSVAESLLSQRLRSLGVEGRQSQQQQHQQQQTPLDDMCDPQVPYE